MACSGKITFQEAQQAIASNWTVAYVKYVGSLPGGAGVVKTTQAPASSTSVTTTTSPVPAVPVEASPNLDGSCPATAPIKVSQTGIYHLPKGDGSYRRTQARRCFATAAAAQAAGYRGIR